ncbi:hypothetical protein ACFQ0T_12335 [Kitasatospora gansuensis]
MRTVGPPGRADGERARLLREVEGRAATARTPTGSAGLPAALPGRGRLAGAARVTGLAGHPRSVGLTGAIRLPDRTDRPGRPSPGGCTVRRRRMLLPRRRYGRGRGRGRRGRRLRGVRWHHHVRRRPASCSRARRSWRTRSCSSLGCRPPLSDSYSSWASVYPWSRSSTRASTTRAVAVSPASQDVQASKVSGGAA